MSTKMMLTNQVINTPAAGVPNGLVVTQNLGQGRTPCLPISRTMREWPMSAAVRLPKADRIGKMVRLAC